MIVLMCVWARASITAYSNCATEEDQPDTGLICYNGGSCSESLSGVECICPAGFVGVQCSTVVYIPDTTGSGNIPGGEE